mmetsp:Transcript_71014/g.157891  ORF Transcript_71014/g.157891 Transcript_71014/m.157891 type:complete len:206 (+) Transcript_71014:655-1272(+)
MRVSTRLWPSRTQHSKKRASRSSSRTGSRYGRWCTPPPAAITGCSSITCAMRVSPSRGSVRAAACSRSTGRRRTMMSCSAASSSRARRCRRAAGGNPPSSTSRRRSALSSPSRLSSPFSDIRVRKRTAAAEAVQPYTRHGIACVESSPSDRRVISQRWPLQHKRCRALCQARLPTVLLRAAVALEPPFATMYASTDYVAHFPSET